MKPTTVIIPGSFDPITTGHLDIISRAVSLYDAVIVLIALNNEKKSMFSLEQRINLIKKSVQHLVNVTVDSWDGLTVDYMKKKSISIIVRGIRNTIDFEIENQLALTNKKLYIDCETVMLSAAPELSAVSSTVVRDLLKHKAELSEFVPGVIEKEMRGMNT